MFWSPSDGAPISPNQPSFGIPGQTKVSGDRQRETTREIFCLAAEYTEMTATFGQTLPRSFKSPYIYYYAHIMKLLCAWLCLQVSK